jgi:hypothetical protein
MKPTFKASIPGRLSCANGSSQATLEALSGVGWVAIETLLRGFLINPD